MAQIIINLTQIALTLAGVLAVIFIIIGGIRYTVSAGNPQAIEGAKKTIVYAIAGLLIAMFAYVIIGFITSRF